MYKNRIAKQALLVWAEGRHLNWVGVDVEMVEYNWAYTFIGDLRPMMKSHMERQWEVRGANKDSTDNTDLYRVYPMLHGRELVAL